MRFRPKRAEERRNTTGDSLLIICLVLGFWFLSSFDGVDDFTGWVERSAVTVGDVSADAQGLGT